MPTIYIVGNKIDLNSRREVDTLELKKFVEKIKNEFDYDIYGEEISVKDNKNIYNIFYAITESIYKEKIHLKNKTDYDDYDIRNNYNHSFSREHATASMHCFLVFVVKKKIYDFFIN